MAVEHAMFKFGDLKVTSRDDRMKSTKCGPSPNSQWSCCLHCKLSDTHKNETKILRTKSAGTIEQKGVAQLLQIEEVRLNYLGQ